MASVLHRDITATLARLRSARSANPEHVVEPDERHVGCDVCCAENRLDWLLSRVSKHAA